MSAVTRTAVQDLSFASPPPIPPGALRRQLFIELGVISNIMRDWDHDDEMTQKIRAWAKGFKTALSTSVDEELICQTHIALLQELLCDPVTLAPLDLYALFNEPDGQTYGQMSLEVYRRSVPEECRSLSPLYPDKPLTPQPHTVVRHMTRWLQRHNALLYSKELERTYVQLLPQQRPMDVPSRMERLVARQAKLLEVEGQRRKVQHKEIDQKIGAILATWEHELPKSLARLAIRKEEVDEDLQARLENFAAREGADFARLNARLDQMGQRVQRVVQETQTEAEEERASLERLSMRIEDRIHSGLDRVAEQVHAFAQDAFSQIDGAAASDQEAVQHIQKTLAAVRINIEDLARRIHELEAMQTRVGDQITQAERDLHTLGTEIQETREIIEKRKRLSYLRVLTSVGIIAGSIFGTWAIAGLLASSSMGITVLPAQGGASLLVSASL